MKKGSVPNASNAVGITIRFALCQIIGKETNGQQSVMSNYSIPHHFSETEISDWLHVRAGDPAVYNYLQSHEPSYGILVNEEYGQLLLWYDASGRFHIVDVTNLSIAKEVAKAPYESPGSSFWENLGEEFKGLFGGIVNWTPWIL